MALIKCPECQHDVSDKAKACPNCAFPFSETKKAVKRVNTKTVAIADNADESILSFLFSPLGRVNRTQFIIFFIPYFVLLVVLNINKSEHFIPTIPLVILCLLTTYVSIIVFIKRLNDANLSAWFMFVPLYGLIALLFFKTVLKNNRYCTLINADDSKKAVKKGKKISIDLEPKSAAGYNDRGYAKYNLKDYKGAIKDYNKAVELNSGDAEIYYFRGKAKELSFDKKGALEDLRKAGERGYLSAYDAIRKIEGSVK